MDRLTLSNSHHKAHLLNLNLRLNSLYNLFEENACKDDAEIIHIENWFPVIHNGYYAIIGYKIQNSSDSYEFILSEPIICCYNSGRVLRTPKKYYILEGDLSVITYEKYDFNNFDNSTINYIGQYAKDCFKNGFGKQWIEDMFKLNILIVHGRLIKTKLHITKLNDKFIEITDPMANFYTIEISEKEKSIFNCLRDILELIKTAQPWKEKLIKVLEENDFKNLVPIIKQFAIKRTKFENEIDKKIFKVVYLWRPERQSGSQNVYNLTGYVFDKDREFVKFSSRICHVFTDGRNIVTKAGLVKLMGPICRMEYERQHNVEVVERVVGGYIYMFSYGFPKYWEHAVTIIDLVLRMDFTALAPVSQ